MGRETKVCKEKRMRRETKVCKEIRKAEDKLNTLKEEHQLIIRARVYAYLITKREEKNNVGKKRI